MSQPDLTVVIPVYDRGLLVRHTLQSVQAASDGASIEIVVVDDGSSIPVANDLASLGISVDQVIRQNNQGLLFARLAGLKAAQGRHVLFLDSDDLVSKDKLRSHIAALDSTGADVSYTDFAGQALDNTIGAVGNPDAYQTLAETTDPAEFFIHIQPAPHSPAFRSDYLRERVANAPFPPSPLYNAVAEIWFYHICAPFFGRVVKCPGLALIGRHTGVRLTNHWERLAVASLAVQEAFARTCPSTEQSKRACQLAAEKAFNAWRQLPRGFSAEYNMRQLAIWRILHREIRPDKIGGQLFARAAHLLGPVSAGRLFRLVQPVPYSRTRTLDDANLQRLIAQLPNS